MIPQRTRAVRAASISNIPQAGWAGKKGGMVPAVPSTAWTLRGIAPCLTAGGCVGMSLTQQN